MSKDNGLAKNTISEWVMTIMIAMMLVVIVGQINSCSTKDKLIKDYKSDFKWFDKRYNSDAEKITILKVEEAKLLKVIDIKEKEKDVAIAYRDKDIAILKGQLLIEQTKALYKQKELTKEIELLIKANNNFLNKLKEIN